MKIGRREIGPGYPCFVVAELSGNHRGNFNEAEALVQAARDAGADAVKLQTYRPETITLNSRREEFLVGGEATPEGWKKKSLWELYTAGSTPWEWQPKLKRLADELGIILFSTPFDETAVEFLERMQVPCYKIASYEAADTLLLRTVAQTGKPVIISFGYSNEADIGFSLKTLRTHGATEIAVLHCVTGYSEMPRYADMHLSNIAALAERFGVVAGFSENYAGIEASLLAAAAGARVVEKHLTLRRASGGPDASFSLEPHELRELIGRIREFEAGKRAVSVPREALGAVHFGPQNAAEEYNKRFCRSLFVAKEMRKGEVFTRENVRSVRPAFGLPTKHLDGILGKRAAEYIPYATPLSWDLVRVK